MLAGSGRVWKRQELLFSNANLLILLVLLLADTFSLSFVLLVSVSWMSSFPSAHMQNFALLSQKGNSDLDKEGSHALLLSLGIC